MDGEKKTAGPRFRHEAKTQLLALTFCRTPWLNRSFAYVVTVNTEGRGEGDIEKFIRRLSAVTKCDTGIM